MKIYAAHTGDHSIDASGSRGIGGSAVGAMYGVNKFKSPYALWAELTGLVSDEFEGNEATRIGQDLERPILERYAKDTEKAIVVPHFTLVHPEHEFMLGNVDAFEVFACSAYPAGTVTDVHDLEFNPIAIIEVKTTGLATQGNARAWADGQVPTSYEFQGMHYCAITNLSEVQFVALIGGQGLQIRERHYNSDQIAKLIEDETAFWELVKSKEPPELDESDSTKEALDKRFPEEEKGTTVEADTFTLDALSMYESARQAEKDAKQEVNYWRNTLVNQIGDAEALTVNGNVVATYKTVTKAEYVVKAQSSRVLSLKKGNK